MGRLATLMDIALAHLVVRTRQTVVGILGVAVGVGFFLAVSAVMVGSSNDFVRTLIDSAPHIVVRDEQRAGARQPALDAFPGAAVQVRGVKPEEEVRGLKDWPAMLADARALPGAIAAPSLTGAISVRFAGRTEPVALNGIDPRLEAKLAKIEASLVGGRLIDLEARPDGIIVTRPLAGRLGAKLGDTLVVASPAGVVQRMRILALVEPDAMAGFYAGDNTAYGLLRTAQVLFARPNVVNQLHIRVADPQGADAAAQRLEGHWGYKWESWQERSRDLLNLLVVRSVTMYVVISAILLVASFGIYSGVSASVTDKRRDIAILRAMGFTEQDVQRVFLIEGLIVGVIGVAVGFAMGTALLEALAHAPMTVKGKALVLPLDRGLGQYLMAGGASMAAALVAAWLPARRAALVDPVDILRGAA
jgi:lipoprotein-releasing system permease protein